MQTECGVCPEVCAQSVRVCWMGVSWMAGVRVRPGGVAGVSSIPVGVRDAVGARGWCHCTKFSTRGRNVYELLQKKKLFH